MRTEAALAPADTGAGRRSRTSPAAVLIRAYLRWLPVLIVAAGTAVRVRQYLFRRSLWLDESLIALNLVQRSYRQLLGPLKDGQAAPVGWLWAERAVVDLAGRSEYALRLVPLLAGVGALFAFWWVARQLVAAWLVPVALAAASAAPYLLHYSNEVKQYESDAAVGLVLLIVSLPLLDDRPGWGRLLAWTAVATLAVWCSHPAVLLLAGYSAVIGGRHLLRRHWATLARVVGASLVWGASFLAEYVVLLRATARNPGFERYWQAGLGPRPLDAATAVHWLGQRWVELIANPLGLAPVSVVTVVLLLGAVALLTRAPARALLLLGPLPVFVIAALMRAYPLRWRLVLVLVPTLLLLAAAAPDWHGGRVAQVGRAAGLVLLAVVLVPPLGGAVALVRHPETVEELRPVLETVKAHRAAGDRLWTERTAGPAFRFYAPTVGLRRDARVRLVRATGPCHARQIIRRAAAGGHRIWFIYRQPRFTPRPPEERAILLSLLDLAGTRVEAVHAPGADAYLYDLRTSGGPGPDGTERLPARWAGYCLRV